MKTLYKNLTGIFVGCICLLSIDSFAQLNSSLIAYYPFSGNANDASPNNLHATNVTASLVNDRDGNPNSAYVFNGNQSITLPRNPSFGDPIMSVSLWFKTETTINPNGASIQRLFASGNKSEFRQNFSLSYNYLNNRKIDFRTQPKAPTGGMELIVNDSISHGVWYHLVAIRDFGLNEVRIYINSNFVESSSIPFHPMLPVIVDTVAIGTYPGASQYFVGAIDDVGVWNRILTPSEIVELFNGADPTGISGIKNSAKSARIDVYPNPSKDRITVKLTKESAVSIYSTNGKVIMQSSDALEHDIDLSTLSPGIYFLKADDVREKIVKL